LKQAKKLTLSFDKAKLHGCSFDVETELQGKTIRPDPNRRD
jgi:hypothetical protein